MEGDISHILNRGVEKREIFLDEEDYLRFVNNLYDFNNKNVTTLSYFNRRSHLSAIRKPKDELVDSLCWCLMPNHHHVLAQEKIHRGTSIFSKKLTSGYTQYFNLKNERSGVLFQGGSKIIPVTRDAHFLHLPYYIFSNPIELIEPGWKEKGIKNFKKVVHFLENYKYSSFLDIIGKDNFPETINKELFYEIYDTNEKRFKRDFVEWLRDFEGDFGEFMD